MAYCIPTQCNGIFKKNKASLQVRTKTDLQGSLFNENREGQDGVYSAI